MPTDPFATIDLQALSRVSGGASSNDQISAALSAITSSLSQLSANRNQSDPTMMMMMMMMMMMNGGGGGGVVAAGPAMGAGPAGAPPVINVDTSVLGRAGGLSGLLGGGGGYGGGYAGGGGCGGGGCGSKKGW